VLGTIWPKNKKEIEINK